MVSFLNKLTGSVADARGTTLTIESCMSVDSAHEQFGMKGKNGETRLVLVPRKNPFRWFTPIPSGMYALMYRSGRFIKVVKPGLRVLPPFARIGYLVTKQYTVFDTPVRDCPTLDNIMVSIDILLVFRIVKPVDFVFRLGPTKLDELLKASQEEAVRGLARSVSYKDVYTLSGKSTGDMVRSMNDKFSEFGVEVMTVTITSVDLPDDVAKSLENATTYRTLKREQEMKQQYEIQVVNDQHTFNKSEEDFRNECIEANKQAEKARTNMNKEIDVIKGEGEKLVASVDAQRHKETERVARDTEIKTAGIGAEREKYVRSVRAETAAGVEAITEQAKAAEATVISQAELHVETNRAKALKIEAETEADAAKQLVARRQFDADKRRLAVLNALAQNENTVITGQNGMVTAGALSSAAMSAEARQRAMGMTFDVMWGTSKR